jgi:hypothetical protein
MKQLSSPMVSTRNLFREQSGKFFYNARSRSDESFVGASGAMDTEGRFSVLSRSL